MKKSDLAESVKYLRSISRGYWRSHILFAAMRLGVFDLLAQQERTPAQLATAAAVSERGATILMRALTGLGLLEKKGDRFAPSALARQMLLQGSPRPQWGMVRHHENLRPCWNDLEACIRTGDPSPFQAASPEELARRRADFMLAMEQNALSVAPEIYEAGRIADCRRLLDIGCGPATFGIEFVRQNAQLHITLVDIAEIINIAKQRVCSAGMDARFSTLPGDFRNMDLGVGQFDAVFVSHVVHMYDADGNVELLRRAGRALRPSGRVLIHDFVLSEDGTQPVEAAIFAVNMLVGTVGGNCYTAQEMFDWLRNAGFADPTLVPLEGDTSLVVAHRDA